MDLRREVQNSVVADEVQALMAVVRPILKGILYALKGEVINDSGGHDQILLRQLARNYRQGDGDCGICFEYAVHEAISDGNSAIMEKIDDALSKHMRIKGSGASSILFGAEKTGAVKLIATAHDILTDDSRLLSGVRGQPVKLKRHIDSVASAFRRRTQRAALPQSISGLWKADLFIGRQDPDQWVGTTVKINPTQLEPARGLRMAVVPSSQGKSDAIQRDDNRNLIVVPAPYDGSFMETFYQAWQLVIQFIDADAQVPKEAAVPRAAGRQVCRFLAERRDFPVVDIIDVMVPLAQPNLLTTQEASATTQEIRKGHVATDTFIAPKPLVQG